MTRDCRSIGTSSGEVSDLLEHCRNQYLRYQFNCRQARSLFEFVSLAKNSVKSSETPVPPNYYAETVTYLQLEYAD